MVLNFYQLLDGQKEDQKLIMAGGNKALLNSVEFSEDDIKRPLEIINNLKINSKDIILGITASGNTPFTCKVLEEATKLDALTIAITNNPNGKILNYANYNIVLDTKGELIAGSTRMKAGTSQKNLFKFNFYNVNG